MIFGLLTLMTALTIAGVAAWFSIEGLMAIFSASAIPIAIMAGSLEVGKLVAASWLYRHWDTTKLAMKTYMTVAVLTLMLITSMGIFGYLSKANLDQAAVGGNNDIQIERIEQQITRQRKIITDADLVVGQLDQAVQTLMDYDRIRGDDGAIAVRESQADERESLRSVITAADARIAELQEDLVPLKEKELQVELKVGPLKYIAEMIYGDQTEDMLGKAVRMFILLLVIVFDPLAVVLIIAANQTLLRHGVDLEKAAPAIIKQEEPDEQLPEEHIDSISPEELEEELEAEYASSPPKESELVLETELVPEEEEELISKIKEQSEAIEILYEAAEAATSELDTVSEENKKLLARIAELENQPVPEDEDIDLATPPAIAELEERLAARLDNDK